MKRKWSLAALLPGFLSVNNAGAVGLSPADIEPELSDEGLKGIVIAPLNMETPLYIAGHRSHSSHGSHRSSSGSSGHNSHSSHSSHRSSAGSGYSSPSSGSGSSSSSSSQPSRPPIRYNSDPLGQPSSPDYTNPSNKAETKKQRQMDRETLILRVQMSLRILGYYTGTIDGVVGPQTRTAIEKYRQDKGLRSGSVIDAELLNSLGISAP